ncbi:MULTISPECIES: (deoxy)nucleoside triphosphate pyrophosphohydrolase [Peptostreptococcus]|jgi:8-oxo-dGTP diphosphatase|uniref:8-oxo-dGTP diphosphatase n=1 Tax=Peptostreptococcus anaerobius TaxID=1261 RepID=A0A135YV80_9FIRM|nr:MULTISPECIES: (deoxy)nucleoside triphosphate pyrophosphohydrolase [Peptostreptococcus]EKX92185.1 mutator mutT protein [Peptostreptococcus anaerobius VPI 4330 = DSM 2949]KXI13314.1 mutator mutT protein [Peptostreptococcus anaerobius]MCB6983687.1 (deoxy)nucleoside triphosphate pyrophosphohydrolase [Peptostreptococcus anaerobius]MCQ5151523.1 (deoxy)nucleoside triphosphate pyrophosphohydrolase [Peptostreptococcus anaerobius]MDB8822294.1 (deoxy)nucleoside triphosphate pyrophosphohydrolase [Pepto
MKRIEVVAAIIKKNGKYLATQRGYGDLKGGWEFPGGKMEEGEDREEALIREIKEELDAQINIEKYFTTVEYDYKSFYLIMHCFICNLIDENISLLEHSNAVWLDKNELGKLDWLPADIEVVESLIMD